MQVTAREEQNPEGHFTLDNMNARITDGVQTVHWLELG